MAKNMQYWKGKFTQSEVNSPFTKNGETKNYVSKRKRGAWGSSGGWESTEFGKGGREGDKKHKSITLRKTEPTTESYRHEDESDKPRYTQTKWKEGGKRKTKEISERKYKRKLARKTARSMRRGDDTTQKNI